MNTKSTGVYQQDKKGQRIFNKGINEFRELICSTVVVVVVVHPLLKDSSFLSEDLEGNYYKRLETCVLNHQSINLRTPRTGKTVCCTHTYIHTIHDLFGFETFIQLRTTLL